jgi:6-pyruvoyltetrahydropterin/6-carboxytetrahydropterin synthase
MLSITRAVRFCVNPPGISEPDRAHNTYAAAPTMIGLGAYYELVATCVGDPHPVTGYLVNITDIDRAVREVAIPRITEVCHGSPTTTPGAVLRDLFHELAGSLPSPLTSLRWRLTPFYAATLEATDMSRVLLSQQFNFAASHRLHAEDLSEEDNLRIYGKCNNPAGHGHNYLLEVTVATPIDEAIPLPTLEQIVDEHVMAALDHKNLNQDVPAFKGIVPSTEHVARFCYDALVAPLGQHDAELRHVEVWETEKTSCRYPADA